MSVHRKGGGWVCRYRDGGKQRSRKFARKTDADRFDREQARRRELGTLHTLAARPVTLDQYVEQTWAPTYGVLLAPRSREVYAWAYDTHIAPRLGGVPLHAITPAAVAGWQAGLVTAGVGHDTLLKARTVLSAVLSTAVVGELVALNPVRAIGAPRGPLRVEVRPLAPVAVEALRARLGHRDAVMVSLLAYAGLRPQEARTLRWGHVHERTLTVGAAKTARRRSVRLLGPLREDLLEWRLASGRPGDDAVVTPRPSDGGAMSARSFNQWRGDVFAPALDAAGLPHARPYDLRHSFASLLLHEGRSVVYVARQLGHSAKVCLDDYGHVVDELEDAPQLPAEQAIRQARNRPLAITGFTYEGTNDA